MSGSAEKACTCKCPNAQFASTGTERDSFVPFPVLGSASSGTVIQLAPYQNWTLCARSHFRYGALPVPVRSFTGPRTGTELCAVGKPVGGFVGSARVGVGLLTCDGRGGIRRLRLWQQPTTTTTYDDDDGDGATGDEVDDDGDGTMGDNVDDYGDGRQRRRWRRRDRI